MCEAIKRNPPKWPRDFAVPKRSDLLSLLDVGGMKWERKDEMWCFRDRERLAWKEKVKLKHDN